MPRSRTLREGKVITDFGALLVFAPRGQVHREDIASLYNAIVHEARGTVGETFRGLGKVESVDVVQDSRGTSGISVAVKVRCIADAA